MKADSALHKLNTLSPEAQQTATALRSAFDDFAQQLQTVLAGQNSSTGTASTPLARDEVQKTVTNALSTVLEQLIANLSIPAAGGQNQTVGVSAATPAESATDSAAASDVSAATALPCGANAQSSTLAPGERGAGLPVNYLKSPLYQEWLARQPAMNGDSIEYGKALAAWQESNPFYINPKNFDTFESYLGALNDSTASSNEAASHDPARIQSALSAYYGAAASFNPWANAAVPPSAEEVAGWPESVQTLYHRTMAAQQSLASLQKAGQI